MTSLQNLFIAKIPQDITDADLLDIFGRFGPQSAKVMLDATTGASKGFGFVLFASEDEGRVAHQHLDHTTCTVRGKSFMLNVCPSHYDGRIAAHSSTALYVRNIPRSVPREDVEALLRSFGPIASSILRDEPNGFPVWMIYVRYEQQRDADTALGALHNNHDLYPNADIPVIAKYAKQKPPHQGPGQQRSPQSQHIAPPLPERSPHDGKLWPPSPLHRLEGSGFDSPSSSFFDTSSPYMAALPMGHSRRSSNGSPAGAGGAGNFRRHSGSMPTPTMRSPQQSYHNVNVNVGAGGASSRRVSTSSFHDHPPQTEYLDGPSGQPDVEAFNTTLPPAHARQAAASAVSGRQGAQVASMAHVAIAAPSAELSPTQQSLAAARISPTNRQYDANGYYRHSPYGFS